MIFSFLHEKKANKKAHIIITGEGLDRWCMAQRFKVQGSGFKELNNIKVQFMLVLLVWFLRGAEHIVYL